MPDVLVVVYLVTSAPSVLRLNTTLTDVTHSGGNVVLQVTLTPGIEPFTLSALKVTVED